MASEQYFCGTCGGPGEHVILGQGDCVACVAAKIRDHQGGTVKATAPRSILKDWVMGLGLRHQGVLLTAVRGCDTAPKHDASKLFTRCIRDAILNPHCGDSRKAATFIEHVPTGELLERFTAFRKNLDHYPHHYVMHVVHAIEVIGYHMAGQVFHEGTPVWEWMYLKLAHALHMRPEVRGQMDDRLNADEETFAKLDRM